MKKRTVKGLGGKVIQILTPESAEELRRLERRKGVDHAESFGDYQRESRKASPTSGRG